MTVIDGKIFENPSRVAGPSFENLYDSLALVAEGGEPVDLVYESTGEHLQMQVDGIEYLGDGLFRIKGYAPENPLQRVVIDAFDPKICCGMLHTQAPHLVMVADHDHH